MILPLGGSGRGFDSPSGPNGFKQQNFHAYIAGGREFEPHLCDSQSNSVVECLRKKPANLNLNARVAQWSRHCSSKAGIAGSSPAVGNSFFI